MITINKKNDNLEVFALMEQYADMREELDPLIEQMKGLETRIKELVAELGEPVAHSGVRATPRDGSEYDYFDTKELTKLLKTVPELEQYHEIRQRKGSVAVSFNG